ncbi:hypothetical protein V9P88_31615, partial [Pseudomonas aeruginosa]
MSVYCSDRWPDMTGKLAEDNLVRLSPASDSRSHGHSPSQGAAMASNTPEGLEIRPRHLDFD